MKTAKPNGSAGRSPRHDEQLAGLLSNWYESIRRPLPWRESKDPYRIWISEVMLQQTTVAAVVPFFLRFIERFPTVQALAKAKLESVLEQWAGLGYYSRARNLHRAAQQIAAQISKTNPSGFPRHHQELLRLPGFGEYTARAVASIAFGEPVGVVDGNVIRVLSRVFDLDLQWWRPAERRLLQIRADGLAQASGVDPSTVNQGLMELGATICTPTSPTCMLCPWMRNCEARSRGTIDERPRPKPRRESEIWHWRSRIVFDRKGESVLLEKNHYAPFLRGHWIWPGKAVRLQKKPSDFHYRGSVTHHDIFVSIEKSSAPLSHRAKPASPARGARTEPPEQKWVKLSDLKAAVPSSLVRKALDALSKTGKLALIGLLSSVFIQCRSAPFPAGKSTASGTASGTADDPSIAPGSQRIVAQEIDGPAFRLDGTATKATAILSWAENRRPLVQIRPEAPTSSEADVLIFASRRPGAERWQVYQADLKKGLDRRLTFDAGDSVPIGFAAGRMVIASSSEAKKNSQEILRLYVSKVRPTTESQETVGGQDAEERKRLLLASTPGRQNETEWRVFSRDESASWIWTTDKAGETALVIASEQPKLAASRAADAAASPSSWPKADPRIFKLSIRARRGHEPTFAWFPIDKIDRPPAEPAVLPSPIVAAALLPDGKRALWSDGSRLWTTLLSGKEPISIGADLPGLSQLVLSPSGDWIVGSTASASRGLSLIAIHSSGRCTRKLTEFLGDELDPSFSAAGDTLYFTHRYGSASTVAVLRLGSANCQ